MLSAAGGTSTWGAVIVVGVDLAESSERGVAAAFGLAHQAPGSDVHLVHVMAHDISLADMAEGRPAALRLAERLNSIAQRRFSASRLDNTRVFTHFVDGNIGKSFIGPELVQLATDLHADIIVIGKGRAMGEMGPSLAPVADYLLCTATCTVLVVNPGSGPPARGIRAPCDQCLEVQRSSRTGVLWCDRHRQEHPVSGAYYEQLVGHGSETSSFAAH